MKSIRSFVALVLTAAVAAACGGGPSLTVTPNFDALTASGDLATLSGTASLPPGSERTGGNAWVPWISCQLGPYTMTWSNAANGDRGNVLLLWDCPKDHATWHAAGIALEPGLNLVTFTLQAGGESAQATVRVTRP